MKLRSTCLVLIVVVLGLAGCGRKEISSTDRKQAVTLVSEAEFAATVREYPRAEGLLVQATELCPDTGGYWVSLGSIRVRMNKRDEARAAYKKALKAFEEQADKDKANSEAALQQVHVLALMGKPDDARELQEKLLKRYPDDVEIRAFVQEKRLDEMLADPQFKQFAL